MPEGDEKNVTEKGNVTYMLWYMVMFYRTVTMPLGKVYQIEIGQFLKELD